MIQNQFVIGKGTDTSDATATSSDILSGKTAYVNDAKITGNIPSKSASNLSASGSTVTVPAGYYPSQVSKSVGTATQATPSISVDSAGKITASATQSAGYVSSGTKSATKQLTAQAAQTITPGTSDKTIASGRYLTGAQTIKGDANLVAANIKSGVSIFGVAGKCRSLPDGYPDGVFRQCIVYGDGTNYLPFNAVPISYINVSALISEDVLASSILPPILSGYIFFSGGEWCGEAACFDAKALLYFTENGIVADDKGVCFLQGIPYLIQYD